MNRTIKPTPSLYFMTVNRILFPKIIVYLCHAFFGGSNFQNIPFKLDRAVISLEISRIDFNNISLVQYDFGKTLKLLVDIIVA